MTEVDAGVVSRDDWRLGLTDSLVSKRMQGLTTAQLIDGLLIAGSANMECELYSEGHTRAVQTYTIKYEHGPDTSFRDGFGAVVDMWAEGLNARATSAEEEVLEWDLALMERRVDEFGLPEAVTEERYQEVYEKVDAYFRPITEAYHFLLGYAQIDAWDISHKAAVFATYVESLQGQA